MTTMHAGTLGLALLGIVATSLFGAGCGWLKRSGYEGFGRDEWQKPAEVVEVLHIEPGRTVADLSVRAAAASPSASPTPWDRTGRSMRSTSTPT